MARPQIYYDFSSFLLFFSCYIDGVTALTAQRILMVNGSNDAVSPKEVPSDWGLKCRFSSSPQITQKL